MLRGSAGRDPVDRVIAGGAVDGDVRLRRRADPHRSPARAEGEVVCGGRRVQPAQHPHVPRIGDVNDHDRARRLAERHPGTAAVGAGGEVVCAGAHRDAAYDPHAGQLDAGRRAGGGGGDQQVFAIRRERRRLYHPLESRKRPRGASHDRGGNPPRW